MVPYVVCFLALWLYGCFQGPCGRLKCTASILILAAAVVESPSVRSAVRIEATEQGWLDVGETRRGTILLISNLRRQTVIMICFFVVPYVEIRDEYGSLRGD